MPPSLPGMSMPEIRPFKIGDIPFAVSQTVREGWNSTEQHFRLCLAHDPAGCFIAAIDRAAVGVVTPTAYPPPPRSGGFRSVVPRSFTCTRCKDAQWLARLH